MEMIRKEIDYIVFMIYWIFYKTEYFKIYGGDNLDENKYLKTFKDVKEKLNLKNSVLDLNCSEKVCDDNCVGIITIKNNKFVKNKSQLWIEYCKRKQDINRLKIKEGLNDKKTIAIILESPHKEEYNNENFKPAPALGTTGTNLSNYFQEIINSVENLEDGEYRIILMNAIQYQCSLGLPTNKYRDKMFLKLWLEEEFEIDFISRLEKYNPDVILNFCTKGNHKEDSDLVTGSKTVINKKYIINVCGITKLNYDTDKEYKNTLQGFVEISINKYIKENNKEIKLFKASHPSSWNIGKNRKIYSCS